MGRAFNRMVKQVAGRRAARHARITLDERLRNIEMMLLQLNDYVSRETFVPEKDNDPHADALVEAMTDYRKTLERLHGA